MTERKWTPGPWVYRPEEFDDWGVVRGSDVGDGWATYICQAKDQRVDEAGENEARRNGIDPWESNAHLIAAAPELYEALDDVVKMLDDNEVPISYEYYCTALEPARAALAKARGE